MDLKGAALRTRDRQIKELEIRKDNLMNSITGVQTDYLIVSMPTNGINTPAKSTENITEKENSMKEISQQLTLTTSQTTTYSVADFLARLSALLGNGKDKRPRMLLLENVKGLLSHDNGNTFRTILWVIDELGYDSQWQVLNSKDFGVPQNRERVFIVGHLRGERRPEVFPIRESNQIFDKQDNAGQGWTQTEYSTALRGSNMKADNTFVKEMNLIYEGAVMSEKNKQWLEDGKELSRNFPQGQRVYNKNGISSTIAGNAGGLGGKTGLYAMRWQRTEKGREERRKNQKNGKDYTPFSDGHREIIPVEGKPVGSLTSQAIAKDSLIGTQIRRLTPIECERLQGFPDNWTAGVSDTQRYKCLGNAVTTNVITEIGKRLVAEGVE